MAFPLSTWQSSIYKRGGNNNRMVGKSKKENKSGVVGELIKRNVDFLQQIAASGRSESKLRMRLSNANTEQLLCFVEICLNILRNRLPLSARQLARLRTHAQQIRALSRTRSAHRARHQLLQFGKGVPAVAGLIASAVLPLLTDYINKRILTQEGKQQLARDN